MKSFLTLAALLLSVIFAQAQNIHLTNNTCQSVDVVLFAGPASTCRITMNTPTLINIAPGSTVDLSLYPGGPFAPVSWNVAPPAGSEFLCVRVIDPGSAWHGHLFNPCAGSSAFVSGVVCTVNATSTGWSSPDVYADLN